MGANTRDVGLVVGVVLSAVSIALVFGMTWYFQSSLNLLQQQVEHDREVVLSLREQLTVSHIHVHVLSFFVYCYT